MYYLQDYKGGLEIIVSDDGSNDNTLQVAESCGEKVKILKKPEHCLSQGVSSTRNRGIKAATYPFICFLDSDDFYLLGHLSKMISALKKKPELGFAFCRVLEIKEKNSKRLFKEWTRRHIFKNDIRNPGVSRGQIVHTNSFIFRKEVFHKVGFFDETYSNGEDGDLWMRISEQYKGDFVDHFGAVYRSQHGNNQLTNNSIEEISNCHLSIYTNAIKRYYQLGLDDQNRIFELKHLVLHNKYRNSKLLYAIKYGRLILKYPLPVLKKILHFFYEIVHKEKNNNWLELSNFINEKINEPET